MSRAKDNEYHHYIMATSPAGEEVMIAGITADKSDVDLADMCPFKCYAITPLFGLTADGAKSIVTSGQVLEYNYELIRVRETPEELLKTFRASEHFGPAAAAQIEITPPTIARSVYEWGHSLVRDILGY